jgi:CheY-like chemotaxis protein
MPEPDRPATAHRVLLVEDNIVNQKLAVALLEKRGHRVRVAADGLAALDLMGRETFDLILMDVQMPGMNGFQVTGAIREREAACGGHIPIVALTAHAMQRDREKCLAAGMDDYLAKPIRPVELDRIIDALAPRRNDESAPLPREKPRFTAAGPEPVALDVDRALDLLGGDESLLSFLAAQALEHFPDQIRELHEQAEAARAEDLTRTAHTLRGVLAQLAAEPARRLAATMEEAAGSGRLAEARALEPELRSAIEGLMPELEKLAARAAAA